MSNKFVIIVLVVVLLFSVAFSGILIASLMDAPQPGLDDTEGKNHITTETETQVGEAGDEIAPGGDDGNKDENGANNENNENNGNNGEDEVEDPNKNEGLTKAPDITFYDLSGNAVKLSDYFGKPIVLNFWASWCGPCKEEMPAFDEVYTQYGGEVVFLMVNRTDGSSETIRSATNYLLANKYSFPVFLDTEREGPTKYGVAAIPYSFFINEDGYIVSKVNAGISKQRLLQEIAKIYNP